MNHKYDIDWLAGWIITQRLGIMQGSKIIGKQSLKLIPIVGWCWIFTESIFIRRIWDSDRQTLVKDMRKIIMNYPKNSYFNVNRTSVSFDFDVSFLFALKQISVFAFLRRNSFHRTKAGTKHENCSRKTFASTETSHSTANQRFHNAFARRRRSKFVFRRKQTRKLFDFTFSSCRVRFNGRFQEFSCKTNVLKHHERFTL